MGKQVTIRLKHDSPREDMLVSVVLQRTWRDVFDNPALYDQEESFTNGDGTYQTDMAFVPLWPELLAELKKKVGDDASGEGFVLVRAVEELLKSKRQNDYQMTIG